MENLEKILKKHKHWLNEDCEGWEEMRANLRNADLRYADLRNADLRNANLRGANLRYADLRGADLRYADLRYANLRGANLRYADLRYADLWNADLRNADLRNADLRNADLRDANVRDADLWNADLRDANVRDADLREAKINWPINCPEQGSFIGFKQTIEGIVTLKILEDSKRSSATTRKCRAEKVEVLKIEDFNGHEIGVAHSINRGEFTYRVGDIKVVKDFDDNRWNECAAGIHFFITKQEAIDYR